MPLLKLEVLDLQVAEFNPSIAYTAVTAAAVIGASYLVALVESRAACSAGCSSAKVEAITNKLHWNTREVAVDENSAIQSCSSKIIALSCDGPVSASPTTSSWLNENVENL